MRIITTHLNPDYDALASAIGLKKLFPDAVIVLQGHQGKSMKNFFIQTIIYSLNIKKINEIDIKSVTSLIIADTSRSDRIGIFSEIMGKKELEVIIFDHHFEENNIPSTKKYLKKRGACTTIVVELLKERNISLEPEEATILMTGIYEDTGNLTFNTTTEYDYLASAYLLKYGANLNTVRDILYHDITIEQVDILKQFIESEEITNVRGVKVVITQASYEHFIPEIAVAVHKYKNMKNLPVLISLLRLDNKIYLIGRSSSPEISVKSIAEYFGGGGHDSAASAVIKEKTLIQVYNELKALLVTFESFTLLARDIMTFPVIYIFENDKISHANTILNRYNINVLPILSINDKKLIGLITRQIIGKCIYHKLQEISVKEYMLTDFYTVKPNASFEIVKDIILKDNQRLLPVVSSNEVVGVITRTDLLKTLYDIENKDNFNTAKPMEKNVNNLLKSEVDKPVTERLKLLGNLSEKLNYRLYLVGGFVRDLILRKKNLDIDLVIEGNGIKFAKYLKNNMKDIDKIKTYEKFKTAKIFFKDGYVFDIATARLEYYESPGSLPIVERSSLKMDLYRRDFTINTLAVDITGKNFGELIDFFGGVKDIKEKKIRIIHNLSFVEDPTRIFRAFRFAVRFNFEIGKQTINLIKNAKSLKLLNSVEGKRIIHELKQIFNEENVSEILKELNKFKLLKFIFPKTVFNLKFLELLQETEDILKWHQLTFPKEKLEKWIIFFMLFIYKLDTKESFEIFEKLTLSERECAKILNCKNEANIILKSLIVKKELDAYTIYNMLRNKHIESMLFSISKLKDRALKGKIIEFMINYRFIKPQLNGYHLIDMGLKPSPIFKEIFEEIIRNKLLGKLHNINDEKNFVYENFIKKNDKSSC